MCSSPKFLDSKDQGFAAKFPNISEEVNVSVSVLHMNQPQITEIDTGKMCKLSGKTHKI